jgi:hypothetical protein
VHKSKVKPLRNEETLRTETLMNLNALMVKNKEQ